MTRALCLQCGGIKFGAFCDCMECNASADPDQPLSIALSDHHLAVPVLERIGELVRAIAAASPDGDLRRAALLEFFRTHFTEAYHRDVAPTLVAPARALLTTVKLPNVTIVVPSALDQWLAELRRTAAFGTRTGLWRLVVVELARNPALTASAKPPRPGSPDLRVVDLRAMTVATCDPDLAVVETGTAEDRQRARAAVAVVTRRREILETVGGVVATRQRAFLVGESPMPVPLTYDELDLGRRVFGRAVLRCEGRDHDLDTLIGEQTDPQIWQATVAAKAKLTELVAGEDHEAPLSDKQLVEMLGVAGIEVRRRDVARYREQLGIASSSRRRSG